MNRSFPPKNTHTKTRSPKTPSPKIRKLKEPPLFAATRSRGKCQCGRSAFVTTIGWVQEGLIDARDYFEAGDSQPGWVGEWVTSNGTISIVAADSNHLKLESSATWSDENTTNAGGFAATVPAPRTSDLEFGGDTARDYETANANGECAVKIDRVGPYLIAGDNGHCGGLNV